MTTSEPGPELDRRVAVAMGWQWRLACARTVYFLAPPGYPENHHALADGPPPPGAQINGVDGFWINAPEVDKFSTDPARIAEMVEWLRTIGDYSDINIDLTAQSGVMARMGFWPNGDVECEWVDAAVDEADSIQHALALLVVAVGEVGSDA